jgi:putative ABC transport system ATP-binding protein
MSSAIPILEVIRLTKRFKSRGGAVEAVRNVSFTVEQGEFVAVMGASGSGKSTLLHLIAGLTTPDEGAVKIAETDLFSLSDYRRTVFRRNHIGLIFQAFNLLPTLSGTENISLPVLLGGRKENAGEINHLIAKLGLNEVCGRSPDTMSGGEQQRIAVCRALATQPSLVLADEPTGSLDSKNSQRLCRTLQDLCREKNTTVLMVTHNPVVAFYAQRVMVLKDGQIIHEGSTREFSSAQEFSLRYVELVEGEQKIQEAVR